MLGKVPSSWFQRQMDVQFLEGEEIECWQLIDALKLVCWHRDDED